MQLKKYAVKYLLHSALCLPLVSQHSIPSPAAELIPLPNYVKQLLLKYLNSVCQPRRPGMPEVTLEG